MMSRAKECVRLRSRLFLLRACGAALLAGMAGCTVGPNYSRPATWWNPASWTAQRTAPRPATVSEPVAEPIDPQWWKLFNDAKLTELESRVAAANLDVRVATVRLAESRATLGVTRADLFPQVNGNANYTREQESKKGVLSLIGGSSSPAASSNGLGGQQGATPNTSIFQPFDLYQYGFDATWELDFWGHVRRAVESSKAQVEASQEARRDTLLTALAELARDYIQLRGVQRNLAITQRNLDTARESLKLTQDRAAGGLTTDLDVANAAAQVATTSSQLPALEAQQQQLINAIALLLGQPPNALQAELLTPKPIPPVPPRIPIGLPSELARRRPDIRRAEAQLHATTADVGVAVASFYPQVTLSGSFAIQATQFKDLGSWASNTYGIGPSLTLPIFQGGRLQRTLELRQADQQEAALTYQRTVLAALHDVDNALTAYETEQQRRARLEQSVEQNRRALSLARDRYTQGVADFLTVLDAERSLLAAEQQLTDSITTVSTNLVQLYKALGGGWETAYPDQPPAAEGDATVMQRLFPD
jgi:NodT family efflux transporter outer membrane factor (OMF) lipoprotein